MDHQTNPVLFLADSLHRGLKPMWDCDILFSPGANMGDWERLSRNKEIQHFMKLRDRRLVVIAVGTNDIGNAVRDHYRIPNSKTDITDTNNRDRIIYQKLVQTLDKLIMTLKELNNNVDIVFSGLIPRCVDYKISQPMIRQANYILRDGFKTHGFWPTYKPFWTGQQVNTDYYQLENIYTGKPDMLHCNWKGLQRMRQYYSQRTSLYFKNNQICRKRGRGSTKQINRKYYA